MGARCRPTQVENSQTGQSVPFVEALAATPLRDCAMERNALRDKLVAEGLQLLRQLAQVRPNSRWHWPLACACHQPAGAPTAPRLQSLLPCSCLLLCTCQSGR